MRGITLAATIERTVDGAFLEVNLGKFAVSTYLTESRAAINVSIYNRCSRSVANGDSDVASGGGAWVCRTFVSTFATSEDTLGHRSGGSTQGAVVDIDIDVASDGAFGVAAAVDAGDHRTVVHVHHGVARHTGLVAATIDVAFDVCTRSRRHSVTCCGQVARHGGLHIADVDLGIRGDTRLVAAAIDIALDTVALCDVNHVDHGADGGSRIGCIAYFVTAAEDMGEVERAGSIFLIKHVDGDHA